MKIGLKSQAQASETTLINPLTCKILSRKMEFMGKDIYGNISL